MAVETPSRPVTTATHAPTATPSSVLRGVMSGQRRSLIFWSIALAAVSVIYITFYPAIGEQQMVDMAEMIPEDMAAALGYDRLGDAAGYLTATVYGLLGPALLLVFSIGTGGRLLAGGEEDGTLELEFAHPVSRRSVYLERLLGLWANVAILVLVLSAVSLALVVVLDLDVGLAGVTAGSLGLLLFVVTHATVAFALGAATGRRAVGLAAAAGLAVVGYVGDAIGPMVEAAEWLQTISPWYWFLGGDPLVEGVDVGGFALLIALTLVVAVVGMLRFQKRDLGV
jgi:ABC-2 type transport system permease protein